MTMNSNLEHMSHILTVIKRIFNYKNSLPQEFPTTQSLVVAQLMRLTTFLFLQQYDVIERLKVLRINVDIIDIFGLAPEQLGPTIKGKKVNANPFKAVMKQFLSKQSKIINLWYYLFENDQTQWHFYCTTNKFITRHVGKLLVPLWSGPKEHKANFQLQMYERDRYPFSAQKLAQINNNKNLYLALSLIINIERWDAREM